MQRFNAVVKVHKILKKIHERQCLPDACIKAELHKNKHYSVIQFSFII